MKSAPKLPLRLRGPQSRTILGVAAACALPFGYGLLMFLELFQSSPSITMMIHYYSTTENALLFELPPLLIFLFGTICVGLLSLRAVKRRGRVSLPGLFGIAIVRTGLVQFIFLIGQTVVIAAHGSSGSGPLQEFGFIFSIGGLIHLALFALVATPLSILCASIFRAVALTRDPDNTLSAFD